jgi:hypothetical protein
MCTLATSTVPFSAQICVLWQLQPYLSVHKYVYFDHINRTFQCTNMCTLATSTVPFSAQICVLWQLQPYLSVHKYVYFGHYRLIFAILIRSLEEAATLRRRLTSNMLIPKRKGGFPFLRVRFLPRSRELAFQKYSNKTLHRSLYNSARGYEGKEAEKSDSSCTSSFQTGNPPRTTE